MKEREQRSSSGLSSAIDTSSRNPPSPSDSTGHQALAIPANAEASTLFVNAPSQPSPPSSSLLHVHHSHLHHHSHHHHSQSHTHSPQHLTATSEASTLTSIPPIHPVSTSSFDSASSDKLPPGPRTYPVGVCCPAVCIQPEFHVPVDPHSHSVSAPYHPKHHSALQHASNTATAFNMQHVHHAPYHYLPVIPRLISLPLAQRIPSYLIRLRHILTGLLFITTPVLATIPYPLSFTSFFPSVIHSYAVAAKSSEVDFRWQVFQQQFDFIFPVTREQKKKVVAHSAIIIAAEEGRRRG